jgi:DNA-binding CsgD family transcriptional regulator
MAASNGRFDIIGALYDAVFFPSRLDDIIRNLAEWVKPASAAGFFVEPLPHASHLWTTDDVDPFYLDSYAGNWGNDDPFDVVKATKVPRELSALTLVAPHIDRAAKIHRILSRSKTTTDSLGAAFAASGFGILLLAESNRVLFANAEADAVVRGRAGLTYRDGQLVATDRANSERLRALVRQFAQVRGDEGKCVGTLELEREADGSMLVAHVVPISPKRTPIALSLERPAAAIIIIDHGADLQDRVSQFAARFGLTAAETRVLAEIACGSGILAAAKKLGVTEVTARTHAKRIFAKTGTSRQTELIRYFFETSLPRSPVR